MSKEMTPKDALNNLNNFISREKHIDSERNKTINECVDTLNQTLDYFEQLEKENQGLKNKNAALKIKVRAWEIQGKKYKKVIDILKNKANIRLHILTNTDGSKIYEIEFIFTYYSTIHEITKQEYELIKEVLESV